MTVGLGDNSRDQSTIVGTADTGVTQQSNAARISCAKSLGRAQATT